jgi:phosphoglycolate phosphatase
MDRPALLIFDLDGTLYCTQSSFVHTVRSVYDTFHRIPPSDEAILATVGEPYGTFLDWAIGTGLPTTRAALERLVTEREFAAIAAHGRLFPGVVETLRALRAADHVLTVCTNGDREYAMMILTTFAVADLFDAVVTHEDAGRTKTQMIADLLDAHPQRPAIVVGDRIHDVEAGRANECIVVGARYGYARPGELDGADDFIDRFPDLIDLIARLP